MDHPALRWAALAAFVPFLTDTAQAQTLLRDQGEHLAVEGQLAPHVPGRSLGEFRGLAIDEAGGILFLAELCPIVGSGSCSQDALYYATDPGAIALVLKDGSGEPSATIFGGVVNQMPFEPRLGADGTMLFGLRMASVPGSVDPTNNSALYYGDLTGFGILARTGDPAPGAPGAVYGPANWGFIQYEDVVFAGSVRAAFITNLTDDDGITLNDRAIFAGTPGAVELVARQGTPAATGPDIGNLAPGPLMQGNAAGMIVYDVSYLNFTGDPPVTPNDRFAILLDMPGGGVVSLLREGDPSPWPGNTFGDSVLSSDSSLNVHGQMFVSAELNPAFIDRGLAVVGPSGDLAVARLGEPAPGIPGATFDFFNSGSLGIADDGTVTFTARVVGPGITAANDTGLWYGQPGAVELVECVGEVAPGTGGLVFLELGSGTLSSGGELDYTAALVDPVSGVQSGSRWRYSSENGKRLVVLTDGTVQPIFPGPPEAIFSNSKNLIGNGSGQVQGLAGNGTAGLEVRYESFLEAVTRVGDELLASSPAELSVAAGGTVELDLHAGSERDGDLFIVLGSASGTAPGIAFGGEVIPLVPDPYFDFLLQNPNTPPFANTLGTLDELGRAKAEIVVTPSLMGQVGVGLDFAFVALDSSLAVSVVSNTTHLELLP